MRFCVDATSVIGDPTGVGGYTRGLVRALVAAIAPYPVRLALNVFRHSGWHARLRAALAGVDGRYEVRPNRLLPHGLLLRADRAGLCPPAEALYGPCDVFHGTNFLAPPCRRARVVVTVHDLAFVRFAGTLAVPHRYRRHLARSLARADRIVAVSRATKRDVVELMGVDPERVAVVHEGAPERFPVLTASAFAAARRRLRIPDRYLLFVGTLEPRKNLVRLIAAFRRVRRRGGGGLGLVLAGRRGWGDEEIRAAIREGRDHGVTATGFVTERLRNSLYANALALVFPSVYEGFGLPVLEAFRAGAPVVAGNRGALPEVAGDAALLVTPEDTDGIAAAIERIDADAALRADLAERGRRRLGRFSWRRAARETLEVYADA